ncbi:MAG: hypothetical protein RML56_04600 [Burkholderiales bacterium]|nr:hypothetical protein [Burkholderiales bacterium]
MGAEHLDQHVDRGVVRVRRRRNPVERGDERYVAGAAQRHLALAVLNRLVAVEARQGLRRPRDAAEMARDERERARFVESSRDDEERVVRPVPRAVERAQALDRHRFDVGTVADHRMTVVVHREREPLHALQQHRLRVVLAHLEFVAHDGHFAREVLFAQKRVHHAIGFHRERPVEVVLARRQRLEVGRAVVRRGAVVARPARDQRRLDVGVILRALEEQVLEQVRHALLAVALVARADEVGDVHGDGARRRDPAP